MFENFNVNKKMNSKKTEVDKNLMFEKFMLGSFHVEKIMLKQFCVRKKFKLTKISCKKFMFETFHVDKISFLRNSCSIKNEVRKNSTCKNFMFENTI